MIGVLYTMCRSEGECLHNCQPQAACHGSHQMVRIFFRAIVRMAIVLTLAACGGGGESGFEADGHVSLSDPVPQGPTTLSISGKTGG